MPFDPFAQARIDARKFNEGFAVAITITTPNGLTTANVTGRGSGRWVKVDDIGEVVSSERNSITLAEGSLTAVSYPVRNADGKVALSGHLVNYINNNGTVCYYVIEDVNPNEMTGLIVCMLGETDQ